MEHPRRRHSLAAALLLAVALAPGAADAQCVGMRRAPATRDSLLVSAAWLSRHIDDAGVVVLHVDRDRSVYDRGHIPGASFAKAEIFLLDPLGAEPLVDSIGRLGITAESRVVLYGHPLLVAGAFVALDVLGHGDRTAVLDRGLTGWREEGLPLSEDASGDTPADFVPRPDGWRIVREEWIRDAADRQEAVIVDARSEEEFEAGHIPTARQLDWRLTLRGGVDARPAEQPGLRTPVELRRLFRVVGIDDAEPLVFYSDDVARAAHLYFVARYLGYTPRLYIGSAPSQKEESGS